MMVSGSTSLGSTVELDFALRFLMLVSDQIPEFIEHLTIAFV